MRDSPLTLPPASDRLRNSFTWRYYYSGEFKFSRKAVRHVRWKRFTTAARLLAPVPRRHSLVDVGCGPGESTIYLAQQLGVERAVGLDLSADNTWFASQLAQANGSGAEFLVGDALVLPVQAGTQDIVVSFEMIEHLPQWDRFFVEARRVLRRGGHLLVTTPNKTGFHSALKMAYWSFRGFGRLNRAYQKSGDFYERFLADRVMKAKLQETGFRVRAVEHVAFVLTIQPDWTVAPATVVERGLEATPGLRRLAVTTAILAEAV